MAAINSDGNNLQTVTIEGQTWAVTPGNEEANMVNESGPEYGQESAAADADIEEASQEVPEDPEQVAPAVTAENMAGFEEFQSSGAQEFTGTEQPAVDSDYDALRAITSLLLGGAIEGSSQLVRRLEQYEAELRRQAAERETDSDETGSTTSTEDELDRLRYAFVGFVLDAQATFRRNLGMWARIADRSTRVTSRVAGPVSNKLFVGPLQRRYDRLVRRGEESLARWTETGRIAEPQSRELAKLTYTSFVDEFINQLAENPELQDLVAQQSIGLASEVRDEVRERTVTADNLLETLVRRVLRRVPRSELPAPPPEIQKWATITLEEYKDETGPED